MFDFSNYRWRDKYPIAAPALLLSGFFVARVEGDETHIYRVSGEYVQQASRSDVAELRRHLLLIDRPDGAKVWGTRRAKHLYRRIHDAA
jgi:hypothetical protein